MKNFFLFLLITPLGALWAQPYSGTVKMSDGQERTGFIKQDADHGVQFGNDASHLVPINAENIAFYEINVNGITEHYEFINAKPSVGGKNPAHLRAMKLIAVGSKLSVYEYHVNSALVVAFGGAETMDLYVLKLGADEAVYFASRATSNIDATGTITIGARKYDRAGFKKFAAEMFQDCPVLVEKIKAKEYKAKDSLAIIEYYNNQCK